MKVLSRCGLGSWWGTYVYELVIHGDSLYRGLYRQVFSPLPLVMVSRVYRELNEQRIQKCKEAKNVWQMKIHSQNTHDFRS